MTNLHDEFGLTRVINASGTYTPVGVSRSSARVSHVVAEALADFFVIDELQAVASAAISRLSGAEAGTVTHCAAAGITLSVAATMTGGDPAKVAALPDASGMPDRVVLPAGHAVDYGHSILTDVRLAGGRPLFAGTAKRCTIADLDTGLAEANTACLLLVSSRLVRGESLNLAEAVAVAHRRRLPAIIDAAAQDMRMTELLATGADLVIFSAQKYLASPTAGLVVGRGDLVAAVRAQEKGIGRAMKATKEGILGFLAACEDRRNLDIGEWRRAQDRKVALFVAQANALPGLDAALLADPAGMPFSRVVLAVDPSRAGRSAAGLARELRNGTPSIRVMEHALAEGQLVLELVPLLEAELREMLARLAEVLSGGGAVTSVGRDGA